MQGGDVLFFMPIQELAGSPVLKIQHHQNKFVQKLIWYAVYHKLVVFWLCHFNRCLNYFAGNHVTNQDSIDYSTSWIKRDSFAF